MTIRHHPDDATLMSFAAGALAPAFAAIVAAHLGLCPRCREEIATLELVGAALIDTLPPPTMSRPRQCRKVGRAGAGPHAPGASRIGATDLPWPIGQLVGRPLGGVRWEQAGAGLWQHHIPMPSPSSGRLRLLKAAPGCAIPEHGHHGAEMTLVLEGAYRDETGEFRVGDVADLDDGLEHTPVADGDDRLHLRLCQ